MAGKENSPCRSRQPRDPFRLVGRAAENTDGTCPPISWDTRRTRSEKSRRNTQPSSQRRAEQSQIGRGETSLTQSVEYVVLSEEPESSSRPIDRGGSSGIFVHHSSQYPVRASEIRLDDWLNSNELEWRQLTEQEFSELPTRVRSLISEHGKAKASAVFDDLAGYLVVLDDGWSMGYQNGADILASMINSTEGSGSTRAVYYYLSVFSTEYQSDPATLAQLKEIQPTTVRAELRKAEADWGERLSKLIQ